MERGKQGSVRAKFLSMSTSVKALPSINQSTNQPINQSLAINFCCLRSGTDPVGMDYRDPDTASFTAAEV